MLRDVSVVLCESANLYTLDRERGRGERGGERESGRERERKSERRREREKE